MKLIERLQNIKTYTLAVMLICATALLAVSAAGQINDWPATAYAAAIAASIVYVITGVLFIFNKEAIEDREKHKDCCR